MIYMNANTEMRLPGFLVYPFVNNQPSALNLLAFTFVSADSNH